MSLEAMWQNALTAREQGRDEDAEKLLSELLRTEPRIAEAHLELAQMSVLKEDLEEAEARAREGVRILRSGGQWILAVSEEVMLAFALNLLGEVLVRRAQGDEMFLTKRPEFVSIWNEAAVVFEEAEKLDPDSEDIRYNRTHVQRVANEH